MRRQARERALRTGRGDGRIGWCATQLKGDPSQMGGRRRKREEGRGGTRLGSDEFKARLPSPPRLVRAPLPAPRRLPPSLPAQVSYLRGPLSLRGSTRRLDENPQAGRGSPGREEPRAHWLPSAEPRRDWPEGAIRWIHRVPSRASSPLPLGGEEPCKEKGVACSCPPPTLGDVGWGPEPRSRKEVAIFLVGPSHGWDACRAGPIPAAN